MGRREDPRGGYKPHVGELMILGGGHTRAGSPSRFPFIPLFYPGFTPDSVKAQTKPHEKHPPCVNFNTKSQNIKHVYLFHVFFSFTDFFPFSNSKCFIENENRLIYFCLIFKMINKCQVICKIYLVLLLFNILFFGWFSFRRVINLKKYLSSVEDIRRSFLTPESPAVKFSEGVNGRTRG